MSVSNISRINAERSYSCTEKKGNSQTFTGKPDYNSMKTSFNPAMFGVKINAMSFKGKPEESESVPDAAQVKKVLEYLLRELVSGNPVRIEVVENKILNAGFTGIEKPLKDFGKKIKMTDLFTKGEGTELLTCGDNQARLNNAYDYLDNPDDDLRKEAIKTFLEIGNFHEFARVTETIDDNNPEIQLIAIEALGEILTRNPGFPLDGMDKQEIKESRKEAIDILFGLLNDDDPKVTKAALSSLKELDITEELKADKVKRAKISKLAQEGPQKVKALAAALLKPSNRDAAKG